MRKHIARLCTLALLLDVVTSFGLVASATETGAIDEISLGASMLEVEDMAEGIDEELECYKSYDVYEGDNSRDYDYYTSIYHSNINYIEGAYKEDTPVDLEEGASHIHGFLHADASIDSKVTFDAFINRDNIQDGTAPFDINDAPGNDSSISNGIVRTFDNIMIPLSITVNPVGVESLSNIELKITGTLDNGITFPNGVNGAPRVNARFAIGNETDLIENEVRFEQRYTLSQTGQAVMLPIVIEVQGAENGIYLTPTIEIQVVSIDGKDVTSLNLIKTMGDIPSTRTSGVPSVQANIRGFNAGTQGLQPHFRISRDPEDRRNMGVMGVAFNLVNLPGRSTPLGATFPTGRINFEIEFSGHVDWDNGERTVISEKHTPVRMIDHQPITANHINNRIGMPNTLMEGLQYNFDLGNAIEQAQSEMPNFSASTIASQANRSVWHSGSWHLNPPKIANGVTTYSGFMEDFVIGTTFPRWRQNGSHNPIFGENDRVFATHGFIFMLPNEFRMGMEHNPENRANNTFYNSTIRIISFEESDGSIHEVNSAPVVRTTSERNNPAGSFSTQQTFRTHPQNGNLGNFSPTWTTVSHGTGTVVRGQDVAIHSHSLLRFVLEGGYDEVYIWNTDAFEMTRAHANLARERLMTSGWQDHLNVRRHSQPDVQSVYFGVANFSDRSLDSLVRRGRDDFTWYTDFDEAIEMGPIAAIKHSVNSITGMADQPVRNIPLRVKTERIGSLTVDDTPNIIVTQVYVFLDAERTRMQSVNGNRTGVRPTMYNDRGEQISLQSPVGTNVHFDTLGIVPALTQSSITPDRTTMFMSDTINWTVRSSITLPATGVGSGDPTIQVTQVLPAGLDYEFGSGRIDGVVQDPLVTQNTNGTTTLVWNLLVRPNNTIADVTFTTSINPLAVDGQVQRTLTVTNVISSPLDGRVESLRRSSANVTVLQVGMVGVHTTLDNLLGERNTSYTVTVRPFTTVEDERDVVGIVPLPAVTDSLGSNFEGTAMLSDIEISGSDNVVIYLNNNRVISEHPQTLDLKSNGWRRWSGASADLSTAKTFLFKVEGTMTHRDNIRISYTIETYGNNFGDEFFNQTTVNSASHFRTSPTSNITRYRIQADVELALERVRVFTDTVESGLPLRVLLRTNIINTRALDEEFKFIIYNEETGEKLLDYKTTIGAVERETELIIPSEHLVYNTTGRFKVRIDGYNENRIYAVGGEAVLSSYGTTSSNEYLDVTLTTNEPLVIEGVIMHESLISGESNTYYERVTIKPQRLERLRTGFGFGVGHRVIYENDLGVSGVNIGKMELLLDSRLVDGYDATSEFTTRALTVTEDRGSQRLELTFDLPKVWVEQYTGHILTEYDSSRTLLDGGNKIYIPIWLDYLGYYETALQTAENETIGINNFSFNIVDTLDVFARMYANTPNNNSSLDKILLRPVLPRTQRPANWVPADLLWLQKNY